MEIQSLFGLPADGSLALSKLASQAQATILGRASGAGSGPPVALTEAQVAVILGAVFDAIDGLTPAAGSFARFDSSTTAAMAAIVGSVSQSGGTPTGSIIERGSNANGEYVKLADGTMVCWANIDATADAWTTASGSFFVGPSNTWVFPAAFVAAGSAAVQGNALLNSVVLHGVMPTALSASQVLYRAWAAASQAAAVAKACYLMATGRWF